MRIRRFIKFLYILCLLPIGLSCADDAQLRLGHTADTQKVYKTPYGRKYHLATCRMVKNVSEEITLTEAKELGLEACLFCQSTIDSNSYGNSNAPKKTQGQSSTVQCKGLTKKGTRCKHRTSIGNGYCFQHQPKN